MKNFRHLVFTIFTVLLCLSSTGLFGQFTQQGNKLVGTGAVGGASQGISVAISDDGTTALVGGPFDDTNVGAVWVYTRTGSTWTQQGSKLVGTGATGAAKQGYSVALSSDGNTALVGGYSDNTNQGAAWVFTRTGSTWTQQGSKLVGTGGSGSQQGISVALSDDGNTALVGGNADNSYQGAVWVFTRTGNTWTQQGSKLVGTGATGAAYQGKSIALSGDGNIALVGGYYDNTGQGAAWVFTRTGGTWTQQGNKLVGTGGSGSQQGASVALSGDGSTALVGGNLDNISSGAVWVYTRTSSTWTQQGSKLVGTGAIGAAQQGNSVALSSDGNTAFVGGYYDNTTTGAAWAYKRTGSTWAQQGSKLVGTGVSVARAFQGFSVALSGDGRTAFVGANGESAAWVFYNGQGVGVTTIGNGTSTIKIFPSPTEGVITIDNDGLTIDNITVYNNVGQLVLTTKVVNQLDLSALPSGMYFVQVKVGGEVATEKVFKQ